MANPNPKPSPDTQFGGPRGNTPGRKHTKDKLSQMFLRDLQEVWEENGKRVLQDLAAQGDLKANAAIAKIMTSLEPKQIESAGGLRDISEEGLQKLIDLATRLTQERKA